VREADVVEAHLRRLDGAEALALVADLWRARGYDTTRRDGVVVVERDGEVSTVAPATRHPATSPDLVVAPSGAPPHGVDDAAVLDAADLRELLWYAVEPSAADDICRRHLGAPPDRLQPPRGLTLRRRLRTVGSWAPLLAVLVALVAGAALGPSLADDPAPDVPAAPDSAADAGTPASGAPAPGADADEAGAFTPDAGVTDLPGANRSGLTDVSALAAAHEAAIRNRSYALWYDEHRPETWAADAPRVHSDVDVTVDGGRYLVVTTETTGQPPRGERVRRIYYDGSAWFVAEETATGTTYRRVADTGEAPSVGRNPFALRETLVRRYLSTPETEYAGYIDQEGDILYRFVGEGKPAGMGLAGVSEYRFFAVVDDSGLVVTGDVEYTLTVDGRRAEIRVRWTYGGFGETTVSAPAWTDAEFGNRTTGT
jgi:hypothetical protein